MKTTQLTVGKMKCEGCTSRVEEIALAAGALSASADLAQKSLILEFNPDFDLVALVGQLDAAGYPTTLDTKE